MKSFWKPRTFKGELIMSFLTISLISIIILGAFQIFQLFTLVKENKVKQSQTTVFLDDYIVNYVKEYQKAVEMLAFNIEPLLEEQDLTTIEKKLEQIKENYPGFVNLYVGNEAGESLVFYPELYTDGSKRENHDFSDRPYYQELRRTKQPVLSSVFHGRVGTNVMLVTAVVPILSEGEMVGYVLGAFDLNALADDIKKRIDDKKSFAIVLDQDDNVIVHPNVDTRKQLVNMKDAAFVKKLPKDNSNTGYYIAEENGEEQYFTFVINEQLGWKVWIATPTKYINDTYYSAITTVLIFALLTTVFMVGISFIFVNRFEKALQIVLRFIKHYKEYTRGFKNKPVFHPSIKATKEIAELYNHFGNLVEEVEQKRHGLIKLNKDLEKRVRERTTTLENKNLELKAVNKLITSVSGERDLAQFIQHCLVQITPFVEYSIHVIFQNIAVTHNKITTITDVQHYLNHKFPENQHMVPIQIGKNLQGFLVVYLKRDQTINLGEQEFLETFASSLAIMLENKFLFERIRNKHAELEAILQSMSEGLMLLNNKDEIEYVNDFFQQIAFSDTNCNSLDLDVMYERFMNLFQISKEELQAFIEEDEAELKLEHVTSNDKVKSYMLHSFSVILDEQTIGKGLLLRDITKEAEIDTLKNNLISLTSHEFKTPITNIRGSVETLLREDVEWEKDFEKELLEGVHEDIERIQHLVSDWMDISKIESGTMYVERNMVRGDQMIEKSLQQIPKELQTNLEVTFENKLKKPVYFYGDKIRVQQVLVNLFMNAIRYNDQLIKKIDITLDQSASDIIISIKDNGIGISEDHLEKIFTRFYQVDVTGTRRTGGTGLGLAICKGIMEAHHGKITVKSEQNVGSTFTLFFPLGEEEE
ncbi:ATP-binding protein [Oceanobacillus sp. AG]|uniref:ATP-binding protein n=1 Tax=Oceanobacillus sp. AG TaxID=2681969 RepID=UPI0012EBA73F|nr:ATP-binding protein [Oceanobacillus sp. AG]